MNARPHCRTPAACVAIGAGHCRVCQATATNHRRFGDPAEREKARQRTIRLNSDPEVRAKQIAGFKRNKPALQACRKRAREQLARINGDPILVERREAGKRAAVPRLRAGAAERLAREVGLPLHLVGEYRALIRRHKMTRPGALGVLRGSYPADFAVLDAERRAAALRSCGPAPAIGTHARTVWSQRCVAALAGLGAEPQQREAAE